MKKNFEEKFLYFYSPTQSFYIFDARESDVTGQSRL